MLPHVSFAVLTVSFAFHAVVRSAALAADGVTLTESTISWSTVKYAISAENGFVSGSLDKNDHRRSHVQDPRARESYLKVTLVPEFGGRILSIIYKPTGHEQLYRTEVGVPYGMTAGNFYYDWLMVYGGIFPTFPDAEHGKAWLKPWDFKVVKESAGEVTVSMSLRDDIAYSAAPAQFLKGSTGIEATYYVTLKADRAALDARVVLRNRRPDDRLRVLDVHDAGAGIGSEKSQDDRRRRNRRADRGLQRAPLVRQSVRRRRERRRRARAVSKNCATSGTGRQWASPTRRPICRAGISGV